VFHLKKKTYLCIKETYMKKKLFIIINLIDIH